FNDQEQSSRSPKRRAPPRRLARRNPLPLGSTPRDFFVLARLRLIQEQVRDGQSPFLRLFGDPIFGRIRVQSRQIHSDLSLVIRREQKAIGHAKKKEHVLRVQVLVNTGRKDGTTREVTSVFGMTAQFVVTVVADGEEIIF